MKKSCYLAAIKKNSDLDRWYSRIRSPYERVFSKQNKRVRYLGIEKNQFAACMEAICFNLKRIAALNVRNLCLC